MKVALVHYWLVHRRGGERVLEALAELFPEADIFTHVFAPEEMQPDLLRHRIQTSFIQKFPGARKYYQYYLPFMPLALEQFDLRGYDLVISSESGPAKGVITGPETTHVCYCHSPMRYVWDMYPEYMASISKWKRLLAAPMLHYMRLWDRLSADRVDHFVANSAFVAKRIQKHYRREADVVHPPVDVEQFSATRPRDDFYLMLGELTEYKRPDLAVQTLSELGRPLVVIGGGKEEKALRAMAGPSVRFLGRQSQEAVVDHLERCKALVFPGLEDFGIVPVEAMAAGAPVLAYGKGGALETVKDGETGLFFHEQSVGALKEVVLSFESRIQDFSSERCRAYAEGFSRERFLTQMREKIASCLSL